MSHESLSDDQVLEEYRHVLTSLKSPYISGFGYIGQSALCVQIMEEVIRRQLLPEAIEISNRPEHSADTFGPTFDKI